jgi:hypothetical protein
MQLDGPPARLAEHGEAWAAHRDPLGRSLRRAAKPDTTIDPLAKSLAHGQRIAGVNAHADGITNSQRYSRRPSVRPDRLRKHRRLRR